MVAVGAALGVHVGIQFETARALRNGWLYTGDIGHVDADGFTYIVDRKKEMIKYKGFGIAPAELESLLMEHPAVLDSAVIGISDPEAGELPKGFVVIRKGYEQVTPDEILVVCLEQAQTARLARYQRASDVANPLAVSAEPASTLNHSVLRNGELLHR